MSAERQYTVRFIAVMIGYSVILFASITALKTMPPDDPLRYLVALLPVIPVLFGFVAYLRYVRQLDEMQQRIQLEGVAFSLGCTGIITFAMGFLENAGLPPFGMIWVFPMSIVLWSAGIALASRRYR
jgi:hypothetical protein